MFIFSVPVMVMMLVSFRAVTLALVILEALQVCRSLIDNTIDAVLEALGIVIDLVWREARLPILQQLILTC